MPPPSFHFWASSSFRVFRCKATPKYEADADFFFSAHGKLPTRRRLSSHSAPFAFSNFSHPSGPPCPRLRPHPISSYPIPSHPSIGINSRLDFPPSPIHHTITRKRPVYFSRETTVPVNPYRSPSNAIIPLTIGRVLASRCHHNCLPTEDGTLK
ncbi:hypothetical protein LX32DRAFT_45743 [Colletotrichum zoysiae]|uniref:Uncharacterized protein n=1 Tax=Colletotrichum zoysiae TaxID=1216348 RepID=A0AAD9HD91_9PEZI|nr:hypothetical protein LX32DRAFT_45743 [Colletotrichum zoysiae]